MLRDENMNVKEEKKTLLLTTHVFILKTVKNAEKGENRKEKNYYHHLATFDYTGIRKNIFKRDYAFYTYFKFFINDYFLSFYFKNPS